MDLIELKEKSLLKKLNRLEYDTSQVQRVRDADFKLPSNRFARVLGYVLKEFSGIPVEEPLGSSLLVNEYIVSTILKEKGYEILNPHGIFEVTIPGRIIGRDEDLVAPAFVREWKEGILCNNIEWPTEEARGQIEKIVQRVQADGFEHYWEGDLVNASNYMWVPAERKIYPYDMSLWTSEDSRRSELLEELGISTN